MSDELLSVERPTYKVAETFWRFERGQPRLVTLLHGSNKDFFETFGLHHPPFRKVAKQERKGVETDFRGFLGQPFEPVDIFGRRHSQADLSRPAFLRRERFVDCHGTMLGRSQRHMATVQSASSVGHEKFVTFLQAQDADSMSGLFVGKHRTDGYVRRVKVTYFFHLRRFISSRICEANS